MLESLKRKWNQGTFDENITAYTWVLCRLFLEARNSIFWKIILLTILNNESILHKANFK